MMWAVTLGDFDITTGGVALGLFTGSTYALLAAGLVLVYRSSGVINFAHSSIGLLGAAFGSVGAEIDAVQTRPAGGVEKAAQVLHGIRRHRVGELLEGHGVGLNGDDNVGRQRIL